MFYLMFPNGADAVLAVKINFCCKILGSHLQAICRASQFGMLWHDVLLHLFLR